jgi:hypothetical protein
MLDLVPLARITPRNRFFAVSRNGRKVIEPGGVAGDVGQEAMPGPSDGAGCHLAVLSQPCRSGQRLQSDNARLLYAILLSPEPCRHRSRAATDAPVPRSAGRPGSSPGQRALQGDALRPAPDRAADRLPRADLHARATGPALFVRKHTVMMRADVLVGTADCCRHVSGSRRWGRPARSIGYALQTALA